VAISGKLTSAFERAEELKINTMQFFSRSPQQWRQNALAPENIAEFRRRKEKGGVSPIFIHIPYLINLASPNPRLYKFSIQAYVEDILEAQALGADYIVTHMGSHKETTEIGGLRRLTRALNKILEQTSNTRVGILLENTAGSGSWLGYKFSHHRKVIERLKDKSRVGLCVDTAHAYLAGYDLTNKDGLEKILAEIETNVGIEAIKLIHLNDAQGTLGSHHDRHAHIGKGGIGLEGIKRIINHARLEGLPFILETPKDSVEADKINLEAVRKLRRK